MIQKYDVCIRGAGVAGRTLALLLARERLRVALVAKPAVSVSSAPHSLISIPDASNEIRA